MKKQALAFATILTLSVSMFAGTTFAEEQYNVRSGDTLRGISENYDLSVVELQQLNELKSSIIYPDQLIQGGSDDDAHVIQQGNTLFNIAKMYGVTVADLKEWNNLPSDLIFVGEKLAIKASAAQSKSSITVRSASKVPATTPANASGETYTMRATAYTAYCAGCSGITANGTDLRSNPNQKVIAVDPRVIPLGTRVWVEGYGEAIAADTGGAIKGNKIDVFIPSNGQAKQWGVRTVQVKLLN